LSRIAFSNAFVLVCVAVVALAVAGWMWVDIRDELRFYRTRIPVLRDLTMLGQELGAGNADAPRADAAAGIRRSLGASADIKVSEDASRVGWTVRRYTVHTGDIAPAALDAFFNLCETATPRWLVEELHVSASEQGRVSAQLTVSELLKN